LHARRNPHVVLAVLAALLLTAPTAQATPQWFDGAVAKSVVLNCPSVIANHPYEEEGAWSWVGFHGDPNDFPDPGQVYYIRVVTGLVGNPCPGGMYSYPEISLPTGVQLAISGDNPIVCWKVNAQTNTVARIVDECPQQPSAGSHGGSYGFGLVGQSDGLWPHGLAIRFELQVPVVSSRQLRGTLVTPCDCIRGFVLTIDGNSSPVLHSNAGLIADAAAPTATPQPTPPTSTPPRPAPLSSPPSGGGSSGLTPSSPVVMRAVAFQGMDAPSSYSIRRLRRGGLVINLQLGMKGCRVKAVLMGPSGAVLARASKVAAEQGRTSMRLRITARGARLLRRARKLRARLRVTVTPPGSPHNTKSKFLHLRR
jgi:hypothetical protein